MAATPLLSALGDPTRAYGAPTSFVAIQLELVTVTETSVVLTWFTGDPTRPDDLRRPAPVPADTEVLLGTSPATLRTVLRDTAQTPYHYAEITGLEPGRTYFFEARSGGLVAAPSAFFPGNPVGTGVASATVGTPFSFTTPQPPPGSFLFSVALTNDLHLGENTAGLITSQGGGLPPGIRQLPGLPPYSQVMAEALVRDARARGASALLAAGDVSSEAASIDLSHAKGYLDAFGTYGSDYLVTRGNHDRPHQGPEYGSCSPVPGAPDYHDCFRDTFFPGRPTYFTSEVKGLRILGLDTYDKLGTGGDNGVLGEAQFAFVRETLRTNPEQPTLVFGHHPVSVESSVTTAVPLFFDLDQAQAQQLEALYVASPGVFLHHSGHTHRNKRTRSVTAPGVTFQEVGAAKEYPGGFMLVRFFTGGYAMNFYKFRSELAREWTERTRQENLGTIPFYTAGTLADRNAVIAHDLSGLRPAASSRPTPAPPSSGGTPGSHGGGGGRGGDAQLPRTGVDPIFPVAGTAALAAGIAAEAWLRSTGKGQNDAL